MAKKKESTRPKKPNAGHVSIYGKTPEITDAVPTGRPSSLDLDPNKRKELLNAIRMGASPQVAASMAGINLRTFQLWMEKGRREYSESDSLYGALLREIMTSWSEGEVRAIATVDAFASGRPATYERDKDGKLVLQPARDKDGAILRDSKGDPILEPIKLRDEIKPNWKAAMEKLRAAYPRRWSYTHHAQDLDAYDQIGMQPEDLAKPEAGTPEEAKAAMDKLKGIMERFAEMGDDDDC